LCPGTAVLMILEMMQTVEESYPKNENIHVYCIISDFLKLNKKVLHPILFCRTY
jgi:hypothetical protein